jgi:hypothetical protein
MPEVNKRRKRDKKQNQDSRSNGLPTTRDQQFIY